MKNNLIYLMSIDINKMYEQINNDSFVKRNKSQSISKLKDLINLEYYLLDQLSYEDLKELLIKFNTLLNKEDDKYVLRTIKKIKLLIHKKYSLDYLIDNFTGTSSSNFDEYEFICTEIFERDLFLLVMYNLSNLEENRYNGNERFFEHFKMTKINFFSYTNHFFECDLINNDFEINEFNLVNNFLYQIGKLDKDKFKSYRNKFVTENLTIKLKEFLCLNNKHLSSYKGMNKILLTLSFIKSLIMLDNIITDYVIIFINRNRTDKNNLVCDFFINNIININNNKENINYLTLVPNKKYI